MSGTLYFVEMQCAPFYYVTNFSQEITPEGSDRVLHAWRLFFVGCTRYQSFLLKIIER